MHAFPAPMVAHPGFGEACVRACWHVPPSYCFKLKRYKWRSSAERTRSPLAPVAAGEGKGLFLLLIACCIVRQEVRKNPLLILCFFFAFSAPGGLSAIAPVIWTRRTFLVYAMVRRVEESAFDFRPEVPILIC
jgi:hypothetical protein